MWPLKEKQEFWGVAKVNVVMANSGSSPILKEDTRIWR